MVFLPSRRWSSRSWRMASDNWAAGTGLSPAVTGVSNLSWCCSATGATGSLYAMLMGYQRQVVSGFRGAPNYWKIKPKAVHQASETPNPN